MSRLTEGLRAYRPGHITQGFIKGIYITRAPASGRTREAGQRQVRPHALAQRQRLVDALVPRLPAALIRAPAGSDMTFSARPRAPRLAYAGHSG